MDYPVGNQLRERPAPIIKQQLEEVELSQFTSTEGNVGIRTRSNK